MIHFIETPFLKEEYRFYCDTCGLRNINIDFKKVLLVLLFFITYNQTRKDEVDRY